MGGGDCEENYDSAEYYLQKYREIENNQYLDSALFYLNLSELHDCQSNSKAISQFIISIYISKCEFQKGINYIDKKDKKDFVYPSQKEVYLNFFSGMKSRKQENIKISNTFFEKSEDISFREYQEKETFDALVDLFLLKLHYQDVNIILEQIDSLFYQTDNESLLYIKGTVESANQEVWFNEKCW